MDNGELRTAARELAASLKSRMGNRLQSVLLYGSLARDEFVAGVSDLNLLLVADSVDASMLIDLGRETGLGNGNGVNPLVVSATDVARVGDTFGIELLDLRDAHEKLVGSNPFENVTVDRDALRDQVERELRTRLLQLHAGLVRMHGGTAQAGELLRAALPSFATLFRALLRLDERPVPRVMNEVIEATCARLGADPTGLLAAWKARTGNSGWTVDPTDPVIESYRSACERAARFVDALEGGGTE
jgi:hypothetical protein